MNNIKIDGRLIGRHQAPYLISEISGNHNRSLDTALRLIRASKEAGVDAVKIQTYRPDTITLKSDLPDFQIRDGIWAGHSLYDLYEWAHTPWEWHEALFAEAKAQGVTLFSSPFDTTAIDFLEDLGAPAYKIASFEAIDLPLIEYAASTGKPLIISTGMANLEEITDAVASARRKGCEDLALLHCVSSYPAPAKEYNLTTIPDMAARYGVPVGLSDHTLSNATAIASVALGASLIEKHITMDRSGGGPDDSFSLEPSDFAALCTDVRTAWAALGTISYDRKPSEAASIQFRRSLYFVRDLTPGETIAEEDIRSVRPGYGLKPKYLHEVIGTKVKRRIMKFTPVTYDDLEQI